MRIYSYIKGGIQIIRDRGPALESDMEAFLYPGFKAILLCQIAHRIFLYRRNFPARWVPSMASKNRD